MKKFLKKIFNNFYEKYNETKKIKKTLTNYNEYIKNNKVRKLHLGAGNINLDSWFNTDLCPQIQNEIFYLDILKTPYFFNDNSFDYIYSEHNFEHFELDELYKILKECLRILKPNGIIRIATPDLNKMIEFYQEDNKINNDYNNWAIDSFIPFAKEKFMKNKAIVFNNFFKCWGHKFIYDYETLKHLLELSGFKKVIECKISKSEFKDLNNIESHWKEIGKRYNSIETMVIEAKKETPEL